MNLTIKFKIQVFHVLVILAAILGVKTNQMFEVTGIVGVLFFMMPLLFNYSLVRVLDTVGDYRPVPSGIASSVYAMLLTAIVYVIANLI